MVGRPVRRVMIAVVVMIGTIVPVVMKAGISDRSHCVVEMRLGGEVSRHEIDVEREQQRGKKTTPPARRVRRAA